jgi:hypothetical protein
VFVLQAGRNRHEHICESLELFGERVLPRFKERADERERAKLERLGPSMQRALERRDPPRTVEPPYEIDEQAELARAAPAGADSGALRERAGEVRHRAERALRKRGEQALARFVRGASDDELERRFGNRLAQQAIFAGMARAFEPDKAHGFEGDIVYELTHRADHRGPDVWSVRVKGSRATARRTDSPSAAIRLRMPVAEFARVVSREVDPALPLLQGRIVVEGDIALAPRLGEMFGQPSHY